MKNLEGFLGKIYPVVLERIREAQVTVPLEDLKRLAAARTLPVIDIKERIVRRQSPVAVIAEIKHASPHRGVSYDRDSLAQVQAYVDGGAVAISVLTEPHYFNGSLEELKQLKSCFPSMPFLRKDFIISEYQLYESKAAGADLVLLIARWLEDNEMKALYNLSRALGLQALVEVEDGEDLMRARALGAEIIGVNARNLADLSVDISRVSRLAASVKDRNFIFVGESGIDDSETVRALYKSGIEAVLAGGALMKAQDPAGMVRNLSLV